MQILALCLVLVVSTAACQSTWWKDFTTNPVTQTETVLSIATSIQGAATITFNQILPRIPAERQPDAQKRFDHASMTLTTAIILVRDAVAAAAQAKEDKPDFSLIIAKVTEAISNIKTIIGEVKGLVAAPVAVAAAPALAAPDGGVAPVAAAPVAAPAPEVDTSDLDALFGRYEARVAAPE